MNSQDVYVSEGLRAMNNWCVWKLETVKGRQTKVPYDIVTGKKASSTDKRTWRTYQLVSDLLKTNCIGYSGLGFMISDGIIFVDVDHCIDDNGVIDERGQDVLSAFPESYAEVSQSGHGIHILTRGTLSRSFNNRKNGVEMYSADRYCAYTGNALQANDPAEEQHGIDYVFHKYRTRSDADTKSYCQAASNYRDAYSDAWIIRHASSIEGQRGHLFVTLFDGDTSGYESASEADSALCTLLAFWTDRNPEQIDRIFRQSGLYRPKWERRDYREHTINHACGHIPESISEYQRRMYRERAMAIAVE